ncbi:hypothetical protein NQ176_g6187 [Zarea fungicola]|uniref:Uncharacterized protein n=1 Tax=Zarea fungicola TaxID=93591 RepID=A0ACC1N6W7_9HYPO|nr:hypothetical protein NQ176_g6187 [Lecanicillium fungicola]
MAIRDRVRRALHPSEPSDTISQTASNTTNTSQSSEGPQLEKTTSRLARAFNFGSSGEREREKERAAVKKERKAQDKQKSRRTHPRDRPLTTQNLRHQEMLGQFSMTFGASDPSQIETMSFIGVSPCCTRPSSRRGSVEIEPLGHGSTTSFSNTSSTTESSQDD